MSAYTDLLDAILVVVRDTDNTIALALREEQAKRRNWRNEIGAGSVPLPFVVVSAARLTGTNTVPSGNGFLMPVTIHLITGVGEASDATGSIMERLIAIWQALLRAELPLQTEDGVVIDGSVASPVMETIMDASAALTGGSLTTRFVIDLSPS